VILTLEVSAPQGAEPGVRRRQVFNEQGGSIGRSIESSWVLPHSKVSGCHALISYRNAVFYIEDTSRNGVFINSPENRLVRGRPYALKSGDRIFIDPYEIRASITEDPNEATRRQLDSWDVRSPSAQFDGSNPFGTGDPSPQRGGSLLESLAVTPPAEAMDGQELDPLKLLPSAAPAPVRKAPPPDPWDGSLLDEHYRPPAVLPDPAPAVRPAQAPPLVDAPLIPQGYDPLAPDDSSVIAPLPPPATPPVAPVSTPSSDPEPPASPPIAPARSFSGVANSPHPVEVVNSPPSVPDAAAATRDNAGAPDLADMLAGAGLEGARVTPELVRSFGKILRVVVSGLMDVLQARQEIKEEFGMRMTRFRPVDNNPLKFSANVDDALHNLLVKRNAAYLAPVEAFADAFDDLRNHQMAMLAGMRVAFESMLAEFAPDRLQEQFDRQLSKGSLISVPAKLRYWDLYRDRHRDMVKDLETSFDELFGEEFARAYEEQLKRLKARLAPDPEKGRR
jgi:type VI secretion system FHA domain protein